jgi:peptide/nickel transport system permease protein
MPKMSTPAMAVRSKKKDRAGKSGPWRDVARRLVKSKSAMVGLSIVLLLVLVACFPQVFAPEGMDEQNYGRQFMPPSWQHLMGTDNLGRDIFSRVIYGAQISIQVGLISVGLACAVGGLLGALAAYYGGRADNLIMRTMDVMLAIPSILLSISIAAALGPGLFNMMVAIGLGNVPVYARVVRAAIMTVKEQEFVEASRAIGANTGRLLLRHMLPNAMAPIIVQATLGVAGAILSAAGLSFLGLGIQPPTPEWGSMLSAGRQYIRDAWWIVTFPGLTIMVTIFALNLLGDGLRDALDPRLKR